MLLKIIYFGQFLWSPFFFFLKAVFMKTILKWEIISFGDGKTRLHLVEIYLLEILMRAWVSVCVLLKTSFYIWAMKVVAEHNCGEWVGTSVQ